MIRNYFFCLILEKKNQPIPFFSDQTIPDFAHFFTKKTSQLRRGEERSKYNSQHIVSFFCLLVHSLFLKQEKLPPPLPKQNDGFILMTKSPISLFFHYCTCFFPTHAEADLFFLVKKCAKSGIVWSENNGMGWFFFSKIKQKK